jgi:hypothetical protein
MEHPGRCPVKTELRGCGVRILRVLIKTDTAMLGYDANSCRSSLASNGFRGFTGRKDDQTKHFSFGEDFCTGIYYYL